MPAIAQDVKSGQILMLGFMNEEAYNQTIQSGLMTFFSRTRQKLWTKGETSGHSLKVKSWSSDCDQDTLLFQVEATGPTCHLGNPNCFKDSLFNPSLRFLGELESIIEQRRAQNDESSYTLKLLNSGLRRVAQKVGEEGVETALALVSASREECIEESADLIFHLLVGLSSRGIELSEVSHCLELRHQSQNKAKETIDRSLTADRIYVESALPFDRSLLAKDQESEILG